MENNRLKEKKKQKKNNDIVKKFTFRLDQMLFLISRSVNFNNFR